MQRVRLLIHIVVEVVRKGDLPLDCQLRRTPDTEQGKGVQQVEVDRFGGRPP
jgi:hypothetical protein